jgi:hypothetical protein
MPKIAMDYSKSIIYKIVCKDTSITECYVGSTTNLTKRRYTHKFRCNTETDRGYNIYVYKFIREMGGWNNWDMVMIEEYACDNKMKLCKQERYWIETLKASLNSHNPNRINVECIENLSEHIKEHNKQYYKDNAEHIIEHQKQYNKDNAERIKQYHKDNAEQLKEYKKQYRKDNSERIKEHKKQYNNEKLGCRTCKVMVSRSSFSRHKKSKRHINNL